jgi:hypothetical protein
LKLSILVIVLLKEEVSVERRAESVEMSGERRALSVEMSVERRAESVEILYQ